MTPRDLKKLAGVHPALSLRVAQILGEMAASGFQMCVTDGVRTTAQQQALYAQGRTKPGAIVTNRDGVTKKSNHQRKSDGYGHAVDCAFLVGGQPSWDARLPWQRYGELVIKHGLVWGGSWTSLHDLPHAELPEDDL